MPRARPPGFTVTWALFSGVAAGNALSATFTRQWVYFAVDAGMAVIFLALAVRSERR